jgi:hypothetical protein
MIFIDKCEINVCRHCNNHCAYCNHGSPLAKPYFMDPETLRRDLAALSPRLHIGFLCLQGGEPLLHPRVMELMDVAKDSGIADQHGFLSNGRLLHKMPEEFFRKCGQMKVGDKKLEFRVSVYANLDVKTLEEPTRKAEQYGFEVRPGNTPIFWKLFYEQKDGGAGVWNVCPCKTCYTIHEGYFYHCPLAAFFPEQFWGLDPHVDGLPLAGLTEKSAAEFLARRTPLVSCTHCAGANNSRNSWHETFNREEWMKEATV